MGAGFLNYTNSKQLNLITDATESYTHNQAALTIAIRFRPLTLSGTTECAILTNGYFEIRRKTGTAAEFEIFFTNASSATEAMSLGNLSVDTDYVVIFKGTSAGWQAILNGNVIGTFTTTGNTWNPGAGANWTVGPANTDIDVDIFEVGYYTADISSTERDNMSTLYFSDARATNLIGYWVFNVEYYGTINNSDENCQNAGSGFPNLSIADCIIRWTGDDPIIPVADISVIINGQAVIDGGTISVSNKLHEPIVLALVNEHISNDGEIIVTTGEDQLPQRILVGASDSESNDLYYYINVIKTITLHGIGRIFGETSPTFSLTLNIIPQSNDNLRLTEIITVQHIRGNG